MRAEQDAVVAALRLTPQDRVYSVGEVPPTPVYPYRVVSVAAGDPRNYRTGSRTSSRFFRAAVQHFARYYADVAAVAERSDAALLDQRMLPTATPCRREIASPVTRDPDADGVLMTTHTYTFTKPA